MRFVLDTSVAFQFFSRDPFVRTTATKLELSSVPELLDELNRDRICRFTGADSDQFSEIVEFIRAMIELREPSLKFRSRAESLISHKNDIPFLALALELKIPILSNDKHFKEQSVVPVYSVPELKELLEG